MGRGEKVGSGRGRSEGAELEGENKRSGGVEGLKPMCEGDGVNSAPSLHPLRLPTFPSPPHLGPAIQFFNFFKVILVFIKPPMHQ
jgi:hypothetical protein